MKDFNNIERGICDVIRQSEIFLPKETLADAEDLVEHHEYGVALELICQQLYESDVKVSSDLYDQIGGLADSMELAPTTYQFLKRARD